MSFCVRRNSACRTMPTLSCPSARSGVLDDRAQVVATKLVAELQPERRHLDADARVEPAAFDVGEYVLVRAHDRRRLLLVRDLLAENVDRRQLPLGVEPPDGLARV